MNTLGKKLMRMNAEKLEDYLKQNLKQESLTLDYDGIWELEYSQPVGDGTPPHFSSRYLHFDNKELLVQWIVSFASASRDSRRVTHTPWGKS